MFGLTLTTGVALLAIGFTAEWLIKKRLQNKKMQVKLMWLAWACAVMGGVAITIPMGETLGVTSLGATVVSAIGLLFIAVDLADRRPDWMAFILIAIIPSFMKLSGGIAGQIFDFLLYVPTQATLYFARSLLGG